MRDHPLRDALYDLAVGVLLVVLGIVLCLAS
jgi:hypothetical protein